MSSLKEIRERAEKATKGPWKFEPLLCGDDRGMGHIFDPAGKEISHHGVMDRWKPENLGNGHFIAAAREDIPDLLDLLDRAKECIKASAHALRSYQYGNSSPDLAEAIADKAESILRELEG